MKKISLLIVIILLLATVTVSAAGGSLRTSVMGDLDGVIIDEIADSQFNSAQIANLGANQIIFANSAVLISDGDNSLNLVPTVVYNLEDEITIGGGLAYQRLNQNNYLQNRGMLAIELDEQLIVGSRIGFNSFFSEDEEDRLEFTLEAGGIYRPSSELTVEAQLGINNYQLDYVDSSDTKLNLFTRVQIEQASNKNFVALMDLKQNDDDRIALGQNHYLESGLLESGLLVYGGELIFKNSNDHIVLNLGAGFEREVIDDLTLRVGQNGKVFSIEDEGLNFSTPALSDLDFGASYEITRTSRVHMSYLPNFTLGSDSNNHFNIQTVLVSEF